MNTTIIPNSISQAFVLGGRAIFTVSNGKGDWHTYRVKVSKKDLDKDVMSRMHFASVLVGPDNESNYAYMGILNLHGQLVLTTKSKLSRDNVRVQIFQWAIKHIWAAKPLPTGYTISHSGKCGRCGRTLTTPDSCLAGFGPECINYVS